MEISTHHSMASTHPISSMSTATGTTKADASSSSGSSATGSSDSATSTASITANDFLQLLVTEMKNQDPTATTDPNQYINQLVQVNSLEQLIQINQDLTGGSSAASGSSSAAATRGNLSANASRNSNIQAAAGHVATAMESRQKPSFGDTASQISSRFPSNLLQGLNSAVKP